MTYACPTHDVVVHVGSDLQRDLEVMRIDGAAADVDAFSFTAYLEQSRITAEANRVALLAEPTPSVATSFRISMSASEVEALYAGSDFPYILTVLMLDGDGLTHKVARGRLRIIK